METATFGNGENPSKLFILLHGYGADKNDLISLAPEFAEYFPDAYFISPNAPHSCEMSPFGYQWFGLRNFSEKELIEGVEDVAPILNNFIDRQLTKFNLKEKDLVLLGFSQGAMMALYVALRREKPVAAVLAFSGLLVGDNDINCKPPVCLIHGTFDPVVTFNYMGQAEKALKKMGVPVEAHARHGLPHGIDPEGIEIAINFAKKCFEK